MLSTKSYCCVVCTKSAVLCPRERSDTRPSGEAGVRGFPGLRAQSRGLRDSLLLERRKTRQSSGPRAHLLRPTNGPHYPKRRARVLQDLQNGSLKVQFGIFRRLTLSTGVLLA